MLRGAIAALALVVLVALPASAEQRTVLVEYFENVGCPSCGAIKDTMDVIFDQLKADGTIIPLRYHTWWPNSQDVCYLHNPTQITDRVNYYSCSYVPSFRFEGRKFSDPSSFGTFEEWYAYFRAECDTLSQVPSDFRIDILDQYCADESVFVSFDVVAVDTPVTGELHLMMAVTETWVRHPVSGRQNDPFRDFIPDSDGEILAMGAGDSLHFDWSYPWHEDYHPDRMQVVIFIQKWGTKKVQQAAMGFLDDVTGVESGDAPIRIVLGANAPNPFNPMTTIPFRLDESREVTLAIYSSSGRLVTELVEGPLGEGDHAVQWNGRDRFGRDVGSGVYYYRLDTEQATLTRKMILIR